MADSTGIYISIITYLVLSAVKVTIGLMTASQALVADGWNNVSDVIASLAILVGLIVARKPADHDHRYGHFRAETAAALVAAFIMAVVGVDVLREAVTTFFRDDIPIMPNPLSMYLAFGSAIILYIVYRINYAIGKRTRNLAVLAAAYDNRSDAFVSIGALVGIAAAQFGWHWADPIVAVIVGFIIVKTACTVGYEALHSLMDGFEEDKLTEFGERIKHIDGVRQVVDLRARYHGSAVHVDVTIGVDYHLTVLESHSLTELIEEKLFGYEGVERVYVHVEPFMQEIHA